MNWYALKQTFHQVQITVRDVEELNLDPLNKSEAAGLDLLHRRTTDALTAIVDMLEELKNGLSSL